MYVRVFHKGALGDTTQLYKGNWDVVPRVDEYIWINTLIGAAILSRNKYKVQRVDWSVSFSSKDAIESDEVEVQITVVSDQ